MFDVGFLEIAIILVLSLLVLGPERLPKAARSVGYWFGKARRYIEGMKSQVEAEFDSTEVKRLLHNQEVQIRELQDRLKTGGDFIDHEYHNQFENKEDPNTDPAPETEPVSRQYDIIEEDDDEWDKLAEGNKPTADDSKTDEAEQADTETAGGENTSRQDKAQ